MTYSTAAKEHLIESQLMTGAMIDERILAAVASVDRSRFVPAKLQGSAYVDGELPLGGGRFLLEPLVFSRMLLFSDIAPGDSVLDNGCATGYSTAVISRLCTKVCGVESGERMAESAVHNLNAIGVNNATIVLSPLTDGYQAGAPYDVILIEGAAGFIPQALADQLKEGGRLVTVEQSGGAGKLGRIVRYLKTGGELYRREEFDAVATPLDELRRPDRFVF